MANLSRTATVSKESCPQSKNRFHQDNKLNKATLPSCPCGSSLVSNLDDFEDSHLAQPVLLTIQQSLIQYSSAQHNQMSTTVWTTHNF